MKQFNARLGTATITRIESLQESMAASRGLPRKLSQAEVIEMAVQALADKELPPPEKKPKKTSRST